ncbi:peptidase [Fannyhessea vaginae]|uniref:peptidase n=1 Tax=Fannyhessea vaginae TaxID=82135 RepID=UPI003A80DD53
MARKHHAKHSKNTILASASAHSFSKLSVGAASAVAVASLALSAAPALAQTESTPTAAQQTAPVVKDQTPAPKAQVSSTSNESGAGTQQSVKNKQVGGGNLGTEASPKNEVTAVSGTDRAATPAPDPKVNSEITLSQDKKDTLPNMYAWGSSDNVYIEKGQNQEVTFKFAKPTDGSTITKVAIFPSDGNTVDNTKSRRFLEYYSDSTEHQPYSGTYDFKVNTDGTATLTMTKLYRDGNLKSGESYSANRCIYVYGTDKDGKAAVLYKTNIVRAATLIPPKTAGSIVLKYNEALTEKQIQDKLKAALDAPTEATGKKSVRDQIVAASKSNGVGGRIGANGAFVQTPDDPEKKIVITDKQAYDVNQVNSINTVTSEQGDKVTTYKTGAVNLKTYLISDLGYKSEALPLTVARYDTRIDKPTVEDPTNVSQDIKTDIIKKLARLNHVGQDKVSINDKGEVSINFDGVDENDAPKIPLRDLVLKKIEEKDISVPAADKAVFVANPLGYSNAELDRIKTAIFEANKDNKELGLTSKDQITLSYLTGDLTATGDSNKGISNGQAENKITVKIKTDKSVAEFTSNVKENKLTKLPDIRKDYDVSWTKTKIDGRDTDEGISWSNDQKTTIIYRYDPTKAEEFDTTKILGLLKATPKDKQAGLRDLTGGEQLSYEGTGTHSRKSHMNYALQNEEPTGELVLGNMSGAYWQGNQKVSNSDVDLGDNLSDAGSYSWDTEAGSVKVAGKKGKIFKARLFVEPYAMTYYKHVYLEQGRNPGNTAKAINVIFVPQTNHKTSDLKTSVEEHKTEAVEGKDVPTQPKYYNASADKKEAYDKALETAKTLLDTVKDKQEKDLTEEQKAQIDNATINLNKARAELDGPDTNKDGLKKSIDANGKAAEGSTAATGTQATNQFKNVSDPDFKKADGSDDTERNETAKKAKADYDKALDEANKVKDDKNATQKAVDDAKAKLDAARAKLNDFTTNKDELNNAIAQHGKVNTGDADKQGEDKLKTADPTYQNSTKEERDAYDKAVAEAQKVVADPNASQKEVNEAIKKLKDAKDALDKNATDKAPLDAAVQKSFDNPKPDDESKQSVFYKNAKAKADNDNDGAARDAINNYDQALAKAKQVLADDKATKKDVEDAKKALEDAEAALHADKYQTKATDLAEAIADNVSGYLMPAYFNAFDLAQSKDPADAEKAKQAAKDFKAYNDAYHAAKDLLKDIKKPNSAVTQDQANEVKNKLIEARKAIDKYATDTSKISAALLHSLAITNSPAYKNASANTDPNSDEAKAKKAYDDALKELQKAFNDQMDKDKGDDGNEIPESVIPDKDIDMTNKDALKKLQAHAKGQPLNRDVTKLLAKLNDAVKGLDTFKTKTDELIKSINEDDNTKQTPAYKNTENPDYKGEDGTTADTDKNDEASAAKTAYDEALKAAKELLKKPDATQKEINDAKTALDNARKALDAYNTDTTKLKESVGKHGSTEGPAPTEGTQTSDAYRNASDPHFLTADGKPDVQKNKQAVGDKKAYDEALTKAQELLKKHDDKDTPLDAQPTQKEIDDALKALDGARKKLEDNYKTVTTDLETEINKSTPEGAPAVTENDFENTPEFKNAKAKTSDGNENADVTAYKEALKKARELVKAANPTDPAAVNSSHPTQQQINDALDALKAAKKQIEDNYKTNLEPLTSAKDFAGGDFKKTPEYQNAVAKKAAGDQGATNDLGKDGEQTGFDNVLKKVTEKLNDEDWKKKATQKDVSALLKQLKDAQDKIAKTYKTDAIKLEREVGDKDQDGKPVTPPFEASVPYKNALAKSNDGDNDATAKLNAYNEKLKAAQDLINKVKNPDPNAAPADRPTQQQVDDALAALKQAKKDIDDKFNTKVEKLQNEVDDKNEDGTARTPKFEESTEFANLQGKTKDGKKPDDLVAYEQALAKAKELIDKNDGKVTKDGQEVDVPKDQLPTQVQVDEAQKALKEIKDKILANYKTNPHDLQEEVDMSKDGDDDQRDTTFENTPEFKNADSKKGENGKDNDDMAAYKTALDAAKKLLDKFDRTTGKPKTDLPAGEKAPTQKQLDDALDALQAAKKKITDGYKTDPSKLKSEADADGDFTKTPEYQNAQAKGDDASKQALEDYKKALEDANKVLGDKNATQAQVDEALQKLQAAKQKLTDAYKTDTSGLVADVNGAVGVNDSDYRNASREAREAYDRALAAAQAVLNNPRATQAEVDAARLALKNAADALIKSAHRARGAKHLAQTSDPTQGFAVMGMITSAFGLIFAGAKRKRQRRQ